MTDKDERKIRHFLDNIEDILARLSNLGLPQYSRRIENLENNIKAFSKLTVKSGLVGITSSGKSSLLNVLLGRGEKVLKEQSKATTNMIVISYKSEEPELEIHFEEGEPVKKRGPKILTESLWKYTSEDENPQNKFNVKYIRLGLPSFLLESGIELADTPGLDAHGHKEHEDLTLREFLPQADLIVYLSSIRSPMKEADRKTLNKIMDADQRIVFVQTCKGAVVERSNESGGSESVEELLVKYKKELQKAISPYPKLKDSPIVQVETTQALKCFKKKDEARWQDSGMDELTFVIKNVTKQLQDEYTLKNLRKTVDEVGMLNTLIRDTLKEEGEKDGSLEVHEKDLKNIRTYSEKIEKDAKKIVVKWKKELDAAAVYKKFKTELSKVYGDRYDFNPMHDKAFIKKAESISMETQKIKNNCLAALDKSRETYKKCFKEMGLDVRRADIQNITKGGFFLPNVQKKRVSDALGGGKGSGMSFWKQKDTASAEYIDKKKFIDDLGKSMKYFFEPLLNHLEWWHKTVTYTFVEPLKNKISAAEDDVKNIKKGSSFDDDQHRNLTIISEDIEDIFRDVEYLSQRGVAERKVARYTKSGSGIIAEQERMDCKNVIAQLYNRIFENMFHSYYMKCLADFSSEPGKKIALVGQDFGSQLSFLRRLFRLNERAFRRVRETSVPFTLNMGEDGVRLPDIPVDGELKDQFSFYVLGSNNESLDAARKYDIFEKADIIQVMVDDLHRVASAISDLKERNMLFDLLNQHRNKLLMTYPRAAYFQKDRLHILVDEAVAEINGIFAPDQIHWLIYENFEIRYSHFNDLALKMIHYNLKPDECIQEWKKLGIPLDDPFNEMTLIEQFEELAA